MGKKNNNVVHLAEYQTSDSSYNLNRGDKVLYEVVVDGKTYKAETDDNGNLVKLRRYNETYGIWVVVNFNGKHSEQAALSAAEILKGTYINRILTATA